MDKLNSSSVIEKLLEITEELSNIENLQAFIDNMRHLGIGDNWDLFEWWEAYLAWSEVSSKEDMGYYYGE